MPDLRLINNVRTNERTNERTTSGLREQGYRAFNGLSLVQRKRPATATFRGTRRVALRRFATPQSNERSTDKAFLLFFFDQHSDRHAPGITKSAMCVQRFDDSLSSAIHTTYRSWLRSSSMHEPRDPPLKVIVFAFATHNTHS